MNKKPLIKYNFYLDHGMKNPVTLELRKDSLKNGSELKINNIWHTVHPEGCLCNCWWADSRSDMNNHKML